MVSGSHFSLYHSRSFFPSPLRGGECLGDHFKILILKYSPEVMLYAIDKFSEMEKFENSRLHKFFRVRYREVLKHPFNEEQLYFYYAIKTMNFTDILTSEKDAVLKSNNQILISYYLKDGIFRNEDISILKTKDEEKYWFQNYHLILYTAELLDDIENSIDRYLIPKNSKEYINDNTSRRAKKAVQKKSYMDFYKENLENNKPIIREISDVCTEIKEYLRLRIEESEADFESEED